MILLEMLKTRHVHSPPRNTYSAKSENTWNRKKVWVNLAYCATFFFTDLWTRRWCLACTVCLLYAMKWTQLHLLQWLHNHVFGTHKLLGIFRERYVLKILISFTFSNTTLSIYFKFNTSFCLYKLDILIVMFLQDQ